MILTHLIMFEFFVGATETPTLPSLPIYSKIHQGVGLSF